MGICEEAGSGWDKIVTSCEAFQLPAPVIETANGSMRVTLYGRRSFRELTPEERADACYWHVCVRYASRNYACNQSLRERFGLTDSNSAQISRLVKTCIDKNLVQLADPNAGLKISPLHPCMGLKGRKAGFQTSARESYLLLICFSTFKLPCSSYCRCQKTS